MKKINNIDDFLDLLRNSPTGSVFNPWWENDPENDDYSNSYEIRQHQLKAYLSERLGHIKYLLSGEALGYQGGHFSGIAMMSERILLGKAKHKGISPEQVFTSLQPSRTSKEEVKKDGFNEPTATMVWQCMLSHNVNPYEFVIWNAFPWHPYQPSKGMLSNRTPTEKELKAGLIVLTEAIKLLNPKQIIAIGEKASFCLNLADIKHLKVRHPANGGATLFRTQMNEIIK